MVTDDEKWYVQRGARLQGPYSRSTLHRYLLLGRIKSSDRVSKDGSLWEPITQVPELIPEELLDLHSDMGWGSYLQARNQVDERDAPATAQALLKPVSQEQRKPETLALARLRDDWTRILQTPNVPKNYASLLPVSLFGITVLVVVVLLAVNVTTIF